MGKYASEVIKQARKWFGCKESDATHKEIIDTYNAHKPLARGYKVKYSDAWCATFVSAVAIKLGYTGIIPTECSCTKMIELFKKMGVWIEDESVKPAPGWIIFYDWSDKAGNSDNKNAPDHVGIVEKVNGNLITVIEGNHDGNDADKIDGVEYRTMVVNGRYIRGYAAPKYDKEPAASSSSSASATNRIDTVREVQRWLNSAYSAGLEVDNDYGKKTKAALVKALQKELGFTGDDVDGIFGPKTKKAVKVLKLGSTGALVKILQALLVCNGYKKAYVDGKYGPGTEDAVTNYQSKKGLKQDGEAGQNTFAALCA